jgi:OFA family oxalate/formate antiporter-like MFS transporter
MAQELIGLDAVRAAALVGMLGLSNGAGRIMWSGLSDYIGRPNTILAFMILEFLSFGLLSVVTNEYVFELLVIIIISSYGAYFAVMPACLIDMFSSKHLSTIHGKILLAWGLAGLFSVPLISLIKTYIGTYLITMNIFAVLMLINIIIIYQIKSHGFEMITQHDD